MDAPQTQYARSGDVNIAYQVVGDGPFDLVYVVPGASNVELNWELPQRAAALRRLSSFSRVLVFDKRGVGLSDRVVGVPSLETRMDDVRAVMDAAGSERAAVLGASEGGPMCILFAATYPERTFALALLATTPRFAWAEDLPWGRRREEVERLLEDYPRRWGTEESVRESWPQFDEETVRAFARYERQSASPGAAVQLMRMNLDIDVRPVLPSVRVPTLVINRTDEPERFVQGSKLIAERVPHARHVEFPGSAHGFMLDDLEEIAGEIQSFFEDAWERGQRSAPPDRVLATVLFTDLVGSTEKAVELGPRWRDLLGEHNAAIRRELSRFSGREIDTAGDGFFASGFDGPARAIRCGCAIRDAVAALGLDVRVGVHTGECELVDGKLAGLAVVAGSGIEFDARGARELKGLGEWPLYAVAGG